MSQPRVVRDRDFATVSSKEFDEREQSTIHSAQNGIIGFLVVAVGVIAVYLALSMPIMAVDVHGECVYKIDGDTMQPCSWNEGGRFDVVYVMKATTF